MKRSDWAVALGLVLCVATLAACGSSASGEGDTAEQEEARLEFAECMRENGVDMPDPQPGQAGMVFGVKNGPGGKSTGINPDDPATKRAMAACDDKLEAIRQDVSPEEKEQFKEDALAFAECMRENGVEMPDPQFSGDGKVKMRIGGPGSGGPSPESPAFQRAQEACQDEMPGDGKGAMLGAPPK